MLCESVHSVAIDHITQDNSKIVQNSFDQRLNALIWVAAYILPTYILVYNQLLISLSSISSIGYNLLHIDKTTSQNGCIPYVLWHTVMPHPFWRTPLAHSGVQCP